MIAGLLGRLLALFAALQIAVAPVQAQTFRPGFQPGFKSGFQFLAAPAAGLSVSKLFATSAGTGAGGTTPVSFTVGFQPDMIREKRRDSTGAYIIADSQRGLTNALTTTSTAAEVAGGASFTVNASGYSSKNWGSGVSFASWAFKQDPRLLSLVLFTGDGTSGRLIPHGLASSVSVGSAVIKRRDTVSPWYMWQSTFPSALWTLNTSDPHGTGNPAFFGNGTSLVSPSAAGVTVGSQLNASGGLYEMEVYAHDAASDGVIQTGFFATDASGNATVSLGWRPQYIRVKRYDDVSDWLIIDTTRGWDGSANKSLAANSTAAEVNLGPVGSPTSTGFTIAGLAPNSSWIFDAIRAVGG